MLETMAFKQGALQRPSPFKLALRTYTMVLALAAIWLTFAIMTDGAFLQPRNLSNLLRQMSVTGILSVGMVLIIVAGHIDLSVGSVVCFLGAVLAVAGSEFGLSPMNSILVTLLAGITIGTFQGWLLSYQRIPAFIVTLGGMMVFRGASMMITKNSTVPLEANWIQSLGTAYVSAQTGWTICILALIVVLALMANARRQAKQFGLETESFGAFLVSALALTGLVVGFMRVLASYEGIPVPVLLMLSLMIIFYVISQRTTWGRRIYAIGGNSDAAFLSGINIRGVTMSIYMVMGFLTALAGVVLTARVGSASPDAGQLLELDAIASCVIGGTSLMGGKGSIPGALLGALVMESLNNGMSLANMEPYWQFVVKGVVLVVAVWADMWSQSRR
ncbi:MAG: sugar ABC transporter permease [Oligoflexia bacterium]|nr:sugar ABC transporter permease [Oligoflexia bacterium]